MLRWKASFDPNEWYEDNADISSIFCFVINSFTWDFQEDGILDTNLYTKLKPCIPVLQEIAAHLFENNGYISGGIDDF